MDNTKFMIISLNEDDDFSYFNTTRIEINFKITKLHMHKYFVVAKYKLVGLHLYEQIWVICFLCQTLNFKELIQFIKNICYFIIVSDDYVKKLNERFLNYETKSIITPETFPEYIIERDIRSLNVEFIDDENLSIPGSDPPFPNDFKRKIDLKLYCKHISIPVDANEEQIFH
jgi:hypothetical protein